MKTSSSMALILCKMRSSTTRTTLTAIIWIPVSSSEQSNYEFYLGLSHLYCGNQLKIFKRLIH